MFPAFLNSPGACISTCLARSRSAGACRYGAAHPRLRSLADVRRALGYFAGAKAGAAPAALLPTPQRDTCVDAVHKPVSLGLVPALLIRPSW